VQSISYSCRVLMKFQTSRYIFEKFSNTIFHKNVFSGRRVVPYGETDERKDRKTDRQADIHKERQTERNYKPISRFSQNSEFALKSVFCHVRVITVSIYVFIYLFIYL
jgi:hypothetical protein